MKKMKKMKIVMILGNNFDPAFGTDWRNYKSYINICENYLINVNYYLGREENPTVIEIVNLEKNKSIEKIDYRIEFKDPYRIKNVNIRQNIAYFYCLNLQNQNIEILTHDMTTFNISTNTIMERECEAF